MCQKIKTCWDQKAKHWDIQVGEEGDRNRRLNSDPVLWDFLGEVKDFTVLDAGCGTGYLSRQLAKKEAVVTGVDISSEMIKVAQQKTKEQDLDIVYHVDNVSELAHLHDLYFDKIVSNYVLMDLPDLQGAVQSLYRVLKPGGQAVIITTHPCFPLGDDQVNEEEKTVNYFWKQPYFEQREIVEGPWGHFDSQFIFYHRPLSAYWKAFRHAGFKVLEFDEPVIQSPLTQEVDPTRIWKFYYRPNSVAFLLEK